ncbi:MAG TPA: hypothetical protein VIL88_17715 [Devosia sp.]|jgi:hypothetical protein|uniref:hypothetical protein n=1 Tax=Devosia sp. TaxID=1871048 RepID=UPI002F93A98E
MSDDLTDLMARLAAGPPVDYEPHQPARIPKPIYNLSVDDPDERSIILIIRTGGDGIVRGMISLPQWYELPEMWDGPHLMADALRLADDYAWHYGYHGIAIDIESSQMWDPAWGQLVTSHELD